MGTLILGWQLICRIFYVYTTQKSRLDDSLEHSKQMSNLMIRNTHKYALDFIIIWAYDAIGEICY